MLTVEITTERAYRIASAEAERLAVLLAQQDRETAHLPLKLRQAMHGATATRLQELQERIASYELLRRSGGAAIELDTLNHLPELLIHARVAANMTQRELASRLGVSEQQVQKDEKTRYAGASFQRLVGICGALSLDIRLHAVLPSSVGELSQISTSLTVSTPAGVSHPEDIEPKASPIEEQDTPSVP